MRWSIRIIIVNAKRFQGAAILGCIASMILPTANGQDACRDILVAGVHNTYQKIQKGSEESSLYKALCTSSDSQNSNGKTMGIGGSYAGYGLNFNNGSTSQASLKSALCTRDESSLSSNDFNSLMVATVDPNIVNNWQECMGGGGLKGNIDVNDDQVMFSLEWRGIAGVNQVTVKGKPRASGVTCDDDSISDGTVLSSNVQVTESCTRKGKEAVTYVVNTSAGSKVLKLSAIKDPPPPPPGPRIWTGPPGAPVQATITARKLSPTMGCCYELDGTFTVPQPGVAASTFRYWRAGSTLMVNGHMQSGMAGFQNGNWQPGDVINFQLYVPKGSTDPADGNSIQICIGEAEGSPCQQTPNLLSLPVP